MAGLNPRLSSLSLCPIIKINKPPPKKKKNLDYLKTTLQGVTLQCFKQYDYTLRSKHYEKGLRE